MKKEVITRIRITASEGMILTDGEIYGTDIFLAEGKNDKDFYEISQEEYEKILKAEEENDILI